MAPLALDGRRVLVTGGLGTIGQAMVVAFADAGAIVTVLDRPGQDAPAGAGWIGADLNDPEGAARAVAKAAPFDVLVNNAALILNRPHEDFTLEEYEDQVRINSTAAFALTRAVSPGMKAARRGRIINMSSVTMNGQWDGFVPYVASKGAVQGLTKGLARELGPHGITVNAISPGAVVSDVEARIFGDRAEAYDTMIRERQCLKSRIVPEDIAAVAVFLASDAARMITGQTIAVDGGW
jgi:NAD(P)-dependent dehydrogenase (short-subunit alcohol dehydrogenase family)